MRYDNRSGTTQWVSIRGQPGERTHDNVRAVLGLGDCLNRYETQRASYPDTDPHTRLVGHIRGIGAHDAIREVLDAELFGSQSV